MRRIIFLFFVFAIIAATNSRTVKRKKLTAKRQIFDTIDYNKGYNEPLSPNQIILRGFKKPATYLPPDSSFVPSTYLPPTTTTQTTTPRIITTRSTTPRIITTQSTTPRIITTRSTTPRIITTRSTTPRIITTRSTTPRIITTQSTTPRIITTRSTTPRIITTRSTTPRIITTRSTTTTRRPSSISTPGDKYIIPTTGPTTRRPYTLPPLSTFPTIYYGNVTYSTYSYSPYTGTYPPTPVTIPIIYTTTTTPKPTGYVYTEPSKSFIVEDSVNPNSVYIKRK